MVPGEGARTLQPRLGPGTGHRLAVRPPFPLASWLEAPSSDEVPFPLGDERRRLYPGSASAMGGGVRALGLLAGDEVLVPAGHSGPAMLGLLAAGLHCRPYPTRARREPDEDALAGLRGTRTRALLLVHHLGFTADAARWRQWCDDQGLLMIEDAVTAWLSRRAARPAGSTGDLAVLSPALTLGLPAGAVSVTAPTPDEPAETPPRGPLSPAVEPLLRRLGNPHVAAVRRAHYAVLLDAFGEQVPSAYRDVPEGSSPFALPVAAPPGGELRRRLAAAGVHPVELPEVGADTIGLPVHQALREHDVDVLASIARAPSRSRDRAPSVEPVDAPEELAAEWTALAEQAGNVFSTWEFTSAWWGLHATGHEPLVHAVRDADGRLIAILPLYRSVIRGVPMAAFMGHGAADQLGPVCAPSARPAAARALKALLRERRLEAHVLVAHRVAADEGWDALLGGRLLNRETSPVLDIGGRDWEGFLHDCSPNLRGQLRRRERKLAREHELTFELVTDRDQIDGALERLFALHDARWAGASSAFAGARGTLHRAFAHMAAERGWLRLWLARVDGAVAAAWYGFRFAGAESYFQSGREPALEPLNVGFVLLARTIRAAIDDRQGEYRFLRGAEPYKRRFATRDAPVDTVVLGHGPVAATVVAATRMAARVPVTRRAIAHAAG